MIPPLIPSPPPKSRPEHEEREDLFATLFSPSTPRASPTLDPVPDDSQPRPFRHSRISSVDSDFGAFVSVTSAEDPLNQFDQDHPSYSPLQNLDFFDRFTEDAKAATERNKKGVLSELLEHEEDPLYFLRTPSTETQKQNRSGASTPIPSSTASPESSTQHSLIDLSPITDFWNSEDGVHDERNTHRAKERSTAHLAHHANTTDPTASPSGIMRSPSLPPSTVRISLPELQPTQSVFASSSFTSSAFPKTWVSSLLSRPSGRRTPSVDETEQAAAMDRHTPSPPIGSSSHSRMQSSLVDSLPPITHGTPFASEIFIPPSGAPGFTGDRTWNTGGFEFDKERAEKKSVHLIGRREMTNPVLTVEVADMIRPNFPALARLPRSWTLLYSLDQHGISLNTLYTRCELHKGGAVVVMQDSDNALFGVWVGEGIHHSKGSYYGGGESFLWKLLPSGQLRIYKWTGKNEYVALCEPEYISFGGGDGHYGLYLDDTLSDGSSAPCPTFNNEPLCSAGPRQGDNVTFECVGLEVWGVG